MALRYQHYTSTDFRSQIHGTATPNTTLKRWVNHSGFPWNQSPGYPWIPTTSESCGLRVGHDVWRRSSHQRPGPRSCCHQTWAIIIQVTGGGNPWNLRCHLETTTFQESIWKYECYLMFKSMQTWAGASLKSQGCLWRDAVKDQDWRFPTPAIPSLAEK